MASVDEQMRRIYLGSWLTRRATEAAGGAVASGATRESLEAVASDLGHIADKPPMEGLEFDPPYPGRIAEDAGPAAQSRLVLTCAATLSSAPLGVVFTVLIAGRRPEVSVAPPGA
jgi:hypothetical protein